MKRPVIVMKSNRRKGGWEEVLGTATHSLASKQAWVAEFTDAQDPDPAFKVIDAVDLPDDFFEIIPEDQRVVEVKKPILSDKVNPEAVRQVLAVLRGFKAEMNL